MLIIKEFGQRRKTKQNEMMFNSGIKGNQKELKVDSDGKGIGPLQRTTNKNWQEC